VPSPQLRLEALDGRRVDEAERHAALAAMHRMVHQVGLVQALEVAAAWHVAKRPAPVHQPIVGDEVQQPVAGHAGTDPFQRMPTGIAQGDQHDRQHGEHCGVQVVLFEPTMARLVVRTVPAPADTVHEVFVGQPGDDFHAGQGDQKDGEVGEHGVRSILRSVVWSAAPRIAFPGVPA